MGRLRFLFLLMICIANGRYAGAEETKRLLASDPNYIHQVEVDMQDLKATVYQLTTQVADLRSQNTKLTAKNADLTSKTEELTSKNVELTSNFSGMSSAISYLTNSNNELTKKNVEIQKILANLNGSYKSLESEVRLVDAGSTYVRWGKRECPTSATLVYAGYAGGSMPNDPGAAVNYLCLPTTPKWRHIPGTTETAYLYGAEYENNFHSAPLDGNEVPCSVCRTNRSTVIMIPATTECLDGWTLEYRGDLAAGRRQHIAASEYVCLDEFPEKELELGTQHNGKCFYPVGSRCGILPCPPYVDYGQLSCVVCTK